MEGKHLVQTSVKDEQLIQKRRQQMIAAGANPAWIPTDNADDFGSPYGEPIREERNLENLANLNQLARDLETRLYGRSLEHPCLTVQIPPLVADPSLQACCPSVAALA